MHFNFVTLNMTFEIKIDSGINQHVLCHHMSDLSRMGMFYYLSMPSKKFQTSFGGLAGLL